MEMIIHYNLKNTENALFANAMTETVTYNTTIDPSLLGIEKQATDLKIAVDHFLEMFKQGQISDITDQLEVLDNQRDNLFVGFYNSLENYLKYPKVEYKEAAHKLKVVIDNYGKSIQTLPYPDESVTLTSILQEIETPEYLPLLGTLGLEQWVADLRQSNDTFKQLYETRSIEKDDYVKGGTAAARKEAQHAFSAYCDMVNAHIKVSGEELYLDLVHRINNIINQAHNAHNQRGPHNPNNN